MTRQSEVISPPQLQWLLNSWFVGRSQWVDATLRSNPTCVGNKG